jgi:hypothetical protein
VSCPPRPLPKACLTFARGQGTGELLDPNVYRQNRDCGGVRADPSSAATCGVRCAKVMDDGKTLAEMEASDTIECTYYDPNGSGSICSYKVRLPLSFMRSFSCEC